MNQEKFEFIDWDLYGISEKVLIGKGGMSSVYRVMKDNKYLAMKCMDARLD